MIKSMTGYGKSIYEDDNKKISIEIKSLNSKQLDLSVKLPVMYKEKEMDIRNLISGMLVRGKVEIFFFVENKLASNVSVINKSIVEDYYKQFSELREQLGMSELADPLSVIMRLPDTLISKKEELEEKEWLNIKKHVVEAINKVNEFRVQEGNAMRDDIIGRVNTISKLNIAVEVFEKERINNIKARINKNLLDFFNEEKIDKNRFEQELLYYLEKIDINEEKVRLENHCSYFLETVNESGEVGKKLNFISQEIGREINTIGSKANNADIQKIVVQMKDELEKIKEQGMNVL